VIEVGLSDSELESGLVSERETCLERQESGSTQRGVIVSETVPVRGKRP
jgi:hypothetical protein